MPLPPLVFLSASATTVLALFCVALAARSSRKRRGNRELLLLLLLGAMLTARSTALGLGWSDPDALWVLACASFALMPPLAALYARNVLLGVSLKHTDLRHAVPAAIVCIALPSALLSGGAWVGLAVRSYAVALQVLAVAYGLWTWRMWRASPKPRWVGGVLAVFGIHWAFSAGTWASAYIPGIPGAVGVAAEAMSMLALVVFGGWALVGALRTHPALLPPAPAPYARTGLALAQRQRLAASLRKTMREDKLYLDPHLSAASLSEAIHATPRELSEVLTREIGQSFFEYVAALRVEAAKERLADPAHAHETILEVLYASGFNSKSAFHRAFREHVGETPSAYRRRAPAPARRAA